MNPNNYFEWHYFVPPKNDLVISSAIALTALYGPPPPKKPLDPIFQELLDYVHSPKYKQLMADEQKYFKPEIQDIHIGYECETHEWSMDEEGEPELNYDRWVPIVLDKNYCTTLLEYGIRGGIRTPYLTIEQIEKEGWIYVKPKKAGTYEPDWIFEKGKLYLQYFPNPSNIIHIWKKGEEFLISKATCKDINTLRLIQKLINIQ